MYQYYNIENLTGNIREDINPIWNYLPEWKQKFYINQLDNLCKSIIRDVKEMQKQADKKMRGE